MSRLSFFRYIYNAASIAGMLLTTECVMCDIKEPEPPMPANPGMGRANNIKGASTRVLLFFISQ